MPCFTGASKILSVFPDMLAISRGCCIIRLGIGKCCISLLQIPRFGIKKSSTIRRHYQKLQDVFSVAFFVLQKKGHPISSNERKKRRIQIEKV